MSANLAPVVASEPSNVTGYRSFGLGKFELSRDAYFVSVRWPAKGAKRSHQMPADAFLRACMRDVAWNFFYGWPQMHKPREALQQAQTAANSAQAPGTTPAVNPLAPSGAPW